MFDFKLIQPEKDIISSYIIPIRTNLLYTKAMEIAKGNIFEIRNEKHKAEIAELNRTLSTNLSGNSFDYIISLNVIEHIYNDYYFMEKILNLLMPNGKLIISTKNKITSLTYPQNYASEYTPTELELLLNKYFSNIEAFGIFGNNKVMDYHEKEKEILQKIKKLDIIYNMPAGIFRIPYKIIRKNLLKEHAKLKQKIDKNDYYFSKIKNNCDNCLDLFYIAYNL